MLEVVMGIFFLLVQVVLIGIALVVVFYLARTIWHFGVRLKAKFPMIGLLWQAMWLLALLLVVVFAAAIAKDEYSSYKTKLKREALLVECKTVDRVEGKLVKAEYDDLRNRGFDGYEAIEEIAEQQSDVGKHVKCVIATTKLSVFDLSDYFENYEE